MRDGAGPARGWVTKMLGTPLRFGTRVLESRRRDSLPPNEIDMLSHHFHTTFIPHHIHLHHFQSYRIHYTSLPQSTHTTFTRITHITHTSHHDHIHTHCTPQHTTSHHDHIHLSLGERGWRLCLAAGWKSLARAAVLCSHNGRDVSTLVSEPTRCELS